MSEITVASRATLKLSHIQYPVNNIMCCQRAEHELNEAKICVLNLCQTCDSVSSISRAPLVFSTRVLHCNFCVKM